MTSTVPYGALLDTTVLNPPNLNGFGVNLKSCTTICNPIGLVTPGLQGLGLPKGAGKVSDVPLRTLASKSKEAPAASPVHSGLCFRAEKTDVRITLIESCIFYQGISIWQRIGPFLLARTDVYVLSPQEATP
jgi:hypothetical protein